MAEQLQIIVDDGSKRVPIFNKQGEEVGEFYFNPTDVGIVDRYDETIQKFDKILEPLQKIGVTEKGEALNAEEKEALDEATKKLYEACNYIFGGNMSEAFFGKVNPFSPINGYFYCENAISAVGSFITSQFDKETKKLSKRINQYTQKYKGKKRR